MAKNRKQDDAYQPLDDAGATELDEPRGPSRGREIKFGLLALVLVVVGLGYIAYGQLSSADDESTASGGSSRLALAPQSDDEAPSQAVVPAVVQAESESAPAPLVMTQWNDLSAAEPAEVGQDDWTPKGPEADLGAVAQEARATEAYSANYGGGGYSTADRSSQRTFVPEDADTGAAGGVAPLASSTAGANRGTDAMSSEAFSSLESDPARAPGREPGSPEGADATPQGVAPMPQSGYANTDAGPWQSANSQGYTAGATANRSAVAPYPSPNRTPNGFDYPAESAPDVYARPQYETAAQEAQQTPAMGNISYSGASTGDMPAADPRPQDYERSTASTPNAAFAGLGSGSESESAPPTSADRWQEPTVTPNNGKYSARPNDNFYTISRKVYGTAAYFRALARYNRDKYPKPNELRIGDVVDTPPVATLESRYPELCPRPEHRDAAKQRSVAAAGRSLAGQQVYVVQEGDSLFDIARFELGSPAKVAELIELNREVLGDQINYLTPGMKLRLPRTMEDRGPVVTQGPTNPVR